MDSNNEGDKWPQLHTEYADSSTTKIRGQGPDEAWCVETWVALIRSMTIAIISESHYFPKGSHVWRNK